MSRPRRPQPKSTCSWYGFEVEGAFTLASQRAGTRGLLAGERCAHLSSTKGCGCNLGFQDASRREIGCGNACFTCVAIRAQPVALVASCERGLLHTWLSLARGLLYFNRQLFSDHASSDLPVARCRAETYRLVSFGSRREEEESQGGRVLQPLQGVSFFVVKRIKFPKLCPGGAC